ncbi:MAG: CHASE2 domain-containing protein [Thermodesulfobacteriota bacterium]
MLKFIKSGISQVLLAGAVLTLAVAALYVVQPQMLQYLDHQSYDILLRSTRRDPPSGIPVIVDLDEKSMREYGQWPWPRYRVALLLARIKQAGALAVGLDILFSEPDRTSLARIQKEMRRDLRVGVNFSGIPNDLLDNDQVLANVLGQGGYVLGYFFNFGGASKTQKKISVPEINPVAIRKPGAPKLNQVLIQASGLVAPLPDLTAEAKAAGFFNTVADRDGLLRRTPLLISCNGKVFPSLALATLREALGNPQIMAKITSGGLESVRIGRSEIPVDAAGRMLIKFPGPRRTFEYVSAADILNGDLDPEMLKERIVFLGTSAAGLKDLRSTPLDPVYPGVEAHASIVDNILRQDFISRPDWAPGLEFCLIVLVGIVFTLMLAWTKARWFLPTALFAAWGIWEGSSFFFSSAQMFISPVYAMLLLIMQVSGLSLVKFFSEEREKRFLRSAFSRYVTPKVVQQIADSPEKLNLGGEEREVSMLFSDIRGFTSISEQLAASQVSDLLRDYFSPMTAIITSNLGTLDKFIGDAVMAFWNAPVRVEKHQLLCAKSAMSMLETLDGLNREFSRCLGVDLKIGIGLHCGVVQVGNMGSRDLFDYTVIGDNVNLTSRLEGLTKYYQIPLLLTSAIAEHCREDFHVQEVDRVRVKGRREPVELYTLHRTEVYEKYRSELNAYSQALDMYRGMDFSGGKDAFARLKNEFAGRPLYVMYYERCAALLASPPPDSWDGVFTHQTK